MGGARGRAARATAQAGPRRTSRNASTNAVDASTSWPAPATHAGRTTSIAAKATLHAATRRAVSNGAAAATSTAIRRLWRHKYQRPGTATLQ